MWIIICSKACEILLGDVSSLGKYPAGYAWVIYRSNVWPPTLEYLLTPMTVYNVMYYIPYYLQWLDDTFVKYLDNWEDSVQKMKTYQSL